MAPAAGGIRAVTIGAWIERVERHGWSDEHVWTVAYEAAEAALSSIRRMLRPSEDLAGDLLSEAVLVAQRCWERWRRPEIADVGLVPWMWGVLRNALRATRRRTERTAGDRVTEVTARDVDDERLPDEALRRLDARAILTPKQLEVWELHCRGLIHREAASRLGITRDAYRDRLRRAKKRLLAGLPAPARHGPKETATLAKVVAASGNAAAASLLALRSLGTSYRRCAEALGLTASAVRSRLSRLWRVWKPSLDAQPTETDLPPPTLQDESAASACDEGGVQSGDPCDSLAPGGALHAHRARRGRDPP